LKSLRTTFWLKVNDIVVFVFVFPIILISAELRWKGLVKEIWASRKRPGTHIENVALLKTSLVYYVWLWINVGSLGWKNRNQDLWMMNPPNFRTHIRI
jgi:hypothetical protein